MDGEDEPISLSDAEAAEARNGQPEEALVVEEVEEEILEVQEEPQQLADDDDLDMFDKAFDSLGAAPQPPPAPAARFEEAQQDAGQPTELSAPDDDAVLRSLVQGDEPVAVNDPDLPVALDPELPAAAEGDLEAHVAELEQRLAERETELEHARKGAGSTTGIIRAKEAKTRAEKEIVRLREELTARDRELVDLHEQQATLESDARQLKEEAARREAAIKALQQRADGLSAAAKKFERELSAAREEAKKGAGEDLRARVAALEEELATARTEMTALNGEKELLAEERDDLRKQLEDAQADSARNEDRAVKAYGRIKSEEMLREKAKKALQIALRLLEENPADGEELEEAAKQAS